MEKKKSRQKKRWGNNIKDWRGLDFASSTRAAENRTEWKKIVAKSSVVPDDLPKLWDRMELKRQPKICFRFCKRAADLLL